VKFTIFKDNGDLLTAMEYSVHLALERYKILEALESTMVNARYNTIIKGVL
jgi:hypothetical protein